MRSIKRAPLSGGSFSDRFTKSSSGINSLVLAVYYQSFVRVYLLFPICGSLLKRFVLRRFPGAPLRLL
jgi:hypothetical protein